MSKTLICTQCGFVGFPKRETPGSFLMEVILWCFFFVPGLIYSFWRITSKYDACPKCKGTIMIPIDSPMGKKLTEGVI